MPTTHYRTHLDLVAADDAVAAGLMLPGRAPVRWWRRMPAEVWLDTDGRVRRMAFPSAGSPSAAHWTITELADFGTPDPIAAPEPTMVVEPREVTSWSMP